MFYEITGIKEQAGESINIHMILDYDSPKKLRDMLQGHEIIILGIKEFLGDEKRFGKIEAEILEGGQSVRVILPEEEPAEAAEGMFELGFDLKSINLVDNPMPEEKMKAILSDAKDAISYEIKQKELEIEEKEEKTKKVYEDKTLQKLQAIVDEILAYLQRLYPKIEGVIIPERLTRLHKLEESLRKQRMGRNPTKIKETLEVLFLLLEKINRSYYKKLKEEGKADVKLFPETNAYEWELIQEYQKLKKSETVQILKLKQSSSDRYYIFFQKYGIYRKFLKRDIYDQLKDLNFVGFKAFELMQLLFAAIAVELGLFLRGQHIFSLGESPQHIFIILIHIGIFAFLLYVLSFFRKRKIWQLILLLAIWVAAYFVISNLIVMNFGL